jgi:predicted nucleic acid-binding protein
VRFWDSSALVPLLVRQGGSPEADRWLAEDAEVVTWTSTPVEIVSALRRLVREGELAERDARRAEDLAEVLLERTHVVADVERVKGVAIRLLRVHGLRAADALQLAAALVWADGVPAGLVLHTHDRRLATAAEREGFEVRPAE